MNAHVPGRRVNVSTKHNQQTLEVCCRKDQKVTCPHFWLGFKSEMLLTFCNDRSECFILHVGAHFRWIWLGEILTDSIWWWGLQCYCMLFYHMHITRQNVSHILAQDSKRSLRKMFSFSKVMIKQFCDQTASALLANLPETTGSQLWDKRAIIEYSQELKAATSCSGRSPWKRWCCDLYAIQCCFQDIHWTEEAPLEYIKHTSKSI